MPVNEVWVFRRENFVGGVESDKCCLGRFYKVSEKQVRNWDGNKRLFERWTVLDELLIAFVDRNKHLLNENAMVREFVTTNGE